MRVFMFGAGGVPEVAAALDVSLAAGKETVLQGFRATAAPDGLGAVLVRDPASDVTGLVVAGVADTFATVMAALGHDATDVVVGGESAIAFGAAKEASAEWDIETWAPRWAAIYARAVTEIGELAQGYSAGQLRRSRDQILVRAASWVRAQGDETPFGARAGFAAEDVVTDDLKRPYLDFFLAEEQHVRFRQFGGGQSASVKRAAFVMGDAVTVLPYDPVRDRVMVVEQFRFGPFVRGDTRPWSLEPIAGRIDPGEAPEAAARREAIEETALEIGALHRIGAYYPSPGAITEYLVSYIGIADLPDGVAGVGGVEDEAEDIRAILLSFDDLMDQVASGAAQNGPLLLSAFWLQANRSTLLPK